jgi:hypothetical protein
MKSTVSRRLAELGRLFEERHKIYGNDYENVGDILMGMFPDGLTLDTPEKFRRFYMFVFMLSKLNRYSQALAKGQGHSDSLKDLAVYATMLDELDE